ncbi:hypothetical protein DL89DRAFT_63584 [Linderina pennispora]|uniref:Uncharacterized protein n=1 Tax=Linderina pennispora TaxID=61395 RepID=A0A1Y1VZG5_9FUNG|nr:uncharacterized protein DL89DRAFT_63584 [Linderina pennispora]ORX66415.1 hypothetical protein DL89DRAFT_63584 [Linderina pennispora]
MSQSSQYVPGTLQKFEDTPHEELKQLVRYDIVSAHWSGGPVGSSMRTFSVLDELADKDSDFWINLIGVLADDEMCEVKLIPDIKKDDDEDTSITSSETCSIPEYGMYTWRLDRVRPTRVSPRKSASKWMPINHPQTFQKFRLPRAM